MNSATLAARIEANPYNLPGIAGAPALCPHDYWAARFEREGRRAYPNGCNPYQPGTMAYDRFACGWAQVEGGA